MIEKFVFCICFRILLFFYFFIFGLNITDLKGTHPLYVHFADLNDLGLNVGRFPDP